MNEPTMTAVLENVDRALNETHPPSVGPGALAEVAKFAPAKYRGANSSGSLQVIHTDIRNKTVSSLKDDIRRAKELVTQLEAVCNELERIVG